MKLTVTVRPGSKVKIADHICTAVVGSYELNTLTSLLNWGSKVLKSSRSDKHFT